MIISNNLILAIRFKASYNVVSDKYTIVHLKYIESDERIMCLKYFTIDDITL